MTQENSTKTHYVTSYFKDGPIQGQTRRVPLHPGSLSPPKVIRLPKEVWEPTEEPTPTEYYLDSPEDIDLDLPTYSVIPPTPKTT